MELALADWALRHGGDHAVAVAIAACARAVADGHSCLALDRELPAIPGEQPLYCRTDLEAALAASELAGKPGESRPLILEAGRLYLHRYWRYEKRLADHLSERLDAEPAAVDIEALLPAGGLFDDPGNDRTQWQAVAAFVALRHRFAVISGGPGTGKTFTVLRLMRLLVGTALETGDAPPVIRLAAPTGKAAARMMEATRDGLDAMEPPAAVRAHIPLEARTLHRLIGLTGSSTRTRHDRDNPLAADAVIVDEASMVDLPLMAKLVEALPAHARLILLGDRYQLASVESGSVLAELCNAGGINAFTPEQQRAAGPLLRETMAADESALANHVVTLQTSHRFAADSRIGELAAAVNAGDADAALAIAAGGAPDITLATEANAQSLDALTRSGADRFEPLRDIECAEDALAQLQTTALLCALRRGPAGATTLNQRITEALKQRRGIDPGQRWYHGRPVMVTRNDYRAGLFNGDTGVALREAGGTIRVWFATDAGLRAFLPSALPEHDTVYAMTVHKSQGSEFDHVTLVLPDDDNPVLTRELLYTGITRARDQVTIVGPEEVLRTGIERGIARYSGLAERIAESDATPI